MWIWIQLPFKENHITISSKKATFDLPWKYLKLFKHQLTSWKYLKLHLNSKPSVSWKIRKLRLTLNSFLKISIYSGNHSKWKLPSAGPTNVKSIFSHCRRFLTDNCLSQAIIVADIFDSIFHFLGLGVIA